MFRVFSIFTCSKLAGSFPLMLFVDTSKLVIDEEKVQIQSGNTSLMPALPRSIISILVCDCSQVGNCDPTKQACMPSSVSRKGGTQACFITILKEFDDKTKVSNLDKLTKWSSDNVPSNELNEISKCVRFDSLPMLAGTSPDIEFLLRSRTLKLVICSSQPDIFPFNLLSERFRICKHFMQGKNFFAVFVISPDRRFRDKSMCTKLHGLLAGCGIAAVNLLSASARNLSDVSFPSSSGILP
ncbi:hypothetical protein BDA96_07G196700 [Sorghum bicolor]|uniref:Uncharacterized protein n=1 Tax=Sorghum bicolor TaxID=4558 RepID=A0A921QLP8_SORBI|nr:hypothetical protein BDA96_07G196700 [Sorghum bicolor]